MHICMHIYICIYIKELVVRYLSANPTGVIVCEIWSRKENDPLEAGGNHKLWVGKDKSDSSDNVSWVWSHLSLECKSGLFTWSEDTSSEGPGLVLSLSCLVEANSRSFWRDTPKFQLIYYSSGQVPLKKSPHSASTVTPIKHINTESFL